MPSPYKKVSELTPEEHEARKKQRRNESLSPEQIARKNARQRRGNLDSKRVAELRAADRVENMSEEKAQRKRDQRKASYAKKTPEEKAQRHIANLPAEEVEKVRAQKRAQSQKVRDGRQGEELAVFKASRRVENLTPEQKAAKALANKTYREKLKQRKAQEKENAVSANKKNKPKRQAKKMKLHEESFSIEESDEEFTVETAQMQTRSRTRQTTANKRAHAVDNAGPSQKRQKKNPQVTEQVTEEDYSILNAEIIAFEDPHVQAELTKREEELAKREEELARREEELNKNLAQFVEQQAEHQLLFLNQTQEIAEREKQLQLASVQQENKMTFEKQQFEIEVEQKEEELKIAKASVEADTLAFQQWRTFEKRQLKEQKIEIQNQLQISLNKEELLQQRMLDFERAKAEQQNWLETEKEKLAAEAAKQNAEIEKKKEELRNHQQALISRMHAQEERAATSISSTPSETSSALPDSNNTPVTMRPPARERIPIRVVSTGTGRVVRQNKQAFFDTFELLRKEIYRRYNALGAIEQQKLKNELAEVIANKKRFANYTLDDSQKLFINLCYRELKMISSYNKLPPSLSPYLITYRGMVDAMINRCVKKKTFHAHIITYSECLDETERSILKPLCAKMGRANRNEQSTASENTPAQSFSFFPSVPVQHFGLASPMPGLYPSPALQAFFPLPGVLPQLAVQAPGAFGLFGQSTPPSPQTVPPVAITPQVEEKSPQDTGEIPYSDFFDASEFSDDFYDSISYGNNY